MADDGTPTDGSPADETAGAAEDVPEARDRADEPTDEAVVGAAVEAAEDVIFSRYRGAEIRDLDVTVRFEDDVLDVDIYLNVPGADDAEQVADDAALAARDAVDELLE